MVGVKSEVGLLDVMYAKMPRAIIIIVFSSVVTRWVGTHGTTMGLEMMIT